MKSIRKLLLITPFRLSLKPANPLQTNLTLKNSDLCTRYFVDKDNNGLCDNFESRSGKGRGANFVD